MSFSICSNPADEWIICLKCTIVSARQWGVKYSKWSDPGLGEQQVSLRPVPACIQAHLHTHLYLVHVILPSIYHSLESGEEWVHWMREDGCMDEDREHSVIWQSPKSITLKVNGTHSMVLMMKQLLACVLYVLIVSLKKWPLKCLTYNLSISTWKKFRGGKGVEKKGRSQHKINGWIIAKRSCKVMSRMLYEGGTELAPTVLLSSCPILVLWHPYSKE